MPPLELPFMRPIALAAVLCLAASTAFAEGPTYDDVKVLPCKSYLPLVGTQVLLSVVEPIVDHMQSLGRIGERFGSTCNITDYVTAVCKERPAGTVGEAVNDLILRARAGSLPRIPRCGA